MQTPTTEATIDPPKEQLLRRAEQTIDDYEEENEWAIELVQCAKDYTPDLPLPSVYAAIGTAMWNQGQGGTRKASLMLDLLWS